MPPKGANQQQRGKQPKGGSNASNSGGSSSSKPGPAWVTPKAITHPEHHHTLNHLDQVASYYAALSAASSLEGPSDTACRLQGEMVRSAKTLSRKAVIRMDTSVKKASCPKCDTIWIQGLTASVRNRVSGPHDHIVKWRCGVCGTIARRPAPDLLPQLQEQREEKDQQQGVKEVAIESSKAAAVEGAVADLHKISQRQRRRIASIKRQLSRQDDPTSADSSKPAPARLTRKQRGDQRRLRIAKRGTVPTASQAIEQSTRPAGPSQPGTIDTPTPPDTHATPAIEQPAHPTPKLSALQHVTLAAASPPAHKKQRTQRPQLAHFNDRVQGSHWDDVFTKLLPADAKDGTTSENTSQTLQYWQKAARSRGDHIVLTGVGKNGALGPQLP